MRLLPNIRFGTERYPEKVARRLRALNITTRIASVVSGGYVIVTLYAGLWNEAMINLVTGLIFGAIPLLHSFGPLVAGLAFVIILYADLFVLVFLFGTGLGMHLYYLLGAALTVLFFGTEHVFLAALCGAVAGVLITILQVLVPYDTGLWPAIVLPSFIANAILSCGILLLIVFYALREAARAEAAAEREYERSETLLANILPASVAERLKNRTRSVIADKYNEASILFADMAGFTARASDAAPDELVRFLNHAFTEFDRLVESHGLEKIKTTGDAYMVVSGVPVPRPDHAEALAQLALELCDAATGLRDPHGRSVPIRIGISSGPVVAGVIGTRKLFYDVWGDAVNVASRMESTGAVGKIQVSQETYERLKDDFVLEDCGEIEVRGKGKMRTWFLVNGKQRPPLEPALPDAAATFRQGSVACSLRQRKPTLRK